MLADNALESAMNDSLTSCTEIDARRALAERIAKAAGARAKSFLGRPEKLCTVVKSSSQDLVSDADKAAEAYLRRIIGMNFPTDGILGEEGSLKIGSSGFDWVIDPIDGTMAFLVGQPNWTVSIAVLENGKPVIGVIFAPMLGETYVAQFQRGALLNDRPIFINQEWSIRSTTVGYGGTTLADPEEAGQFVTRLYSEGGVIFRVGSGALMLAYVAGNRLAGYYDPSLFCWDCMAGIVLVREAGGVVEFAGDLSSPGAIWAGNRNVYDHLKQLTKDFKHKARS